MLVNLPCSWWLQIVLRIEGLNPLSLPSQLRQALISALGTAVPAANASATELINVAQGAPAPSQQPSLSDGVCACSCVHVLPHLHSHISRRKIARIFVCPIVLILAITASCLCHGIREHPLQA